MIDREMIDAFNDWWYKTDEAGASFAEQNYDGAARSVARLGFEAGIKYVLSSYGKPLTHQLALSVLADDEAAIFALVDRLIDDRVLPAGIGVTISIKDMPMPNDIYDTKRGRITIQAITSHSKKLPELIVHYHFNTDSRPFRHHAMNITRFLGWAKRVKK